MVLGRSQEAMAAYRRSMELEPDRAMTLVPMAAILRESGRVAEALRMLVSAVSAAPEVAYARAVRSMVRSAVRDFHGARDDAQASIRLDSTYQLPGLSALARVSWLLIDTVRANESLEKARAAIVDQQAPSPTEASFFASALVAMGRLDEAAEVVRRARPRSAWLWFYFQRAEFEQLRKHPGVGAVLAEANPRAP